MTTKDLKGRAAAAAAAPLVLIDADKGGVGKSFLARIVTWKLSAAGVPLSLFDGDERNAHLDRYYGKVVPVTRFDAREEAGWTTLFNHLDEVFNDTVVLADLPAGVGQQLHREMRRLRQNEQLGTPTIHLWIGDHGEDAVRLFRDLIEVAPASNTVFVINKKEDENLARSIWLQSKTRAAFLAEGGVEVTLPRLTTEVHDRVARNAMAFPTERPLEWARGHWLSFLEYSAQVDRELQPLLALIEEVRS